MENITATRPPYKLEAVLLAFIYRGIKGMNKLEANNDYGETCLNTSVSQLEIDYGIYFIHKAERLVNRVGMLTTFTRYIVLCDKNESKAKQQVNTFRAKRGLPSIKQW